MTTRPARGLAWVVIAVAAGLVAACDETPPPPPVAPPPDTSGIEPQPSVYLLRTSQMQGYKRTLSEALSPANLASAAGDPALATQLNQQGYEVGARWTYQPPTPVSGPPFQQVISQAALFHTTSGAIANAGAERIRQDVPPQGGGSVTTITDLPATGVDELAVYAEVSTDGTQQARSFLAILRRGRVVVELVVGGDLVHATEAAFAPILALQEQQLTSAPG